MPIEEYRSGGHELLKKPGETLRIFFVFLVDGVSELSQLFPGLGGVDDVELFHLKQNSCEGFGSLLLFNTDGAHSLAEMLLKIAEANPEGSQCCVVFLG